MVLKKKLNNASANVAAWSFEEENQAGITIGLYKKPEKNGFAGNAFEVVSVSSDNGKLVCRVNMKRLKEFGGELVIE